MIKFFYSKYLIYKNKFNNNFFFVINKIITQLIIKILITIIDQIIFFMNSKNQFNLNKIEIVKFINFNFNKILFIRFVLFFFLLILIILFYFVNMYICLIIFLLILIQIGFIWYLINQICSIKISFFKLNYLIFKSSILLLIILIFFIYFKWLILIIKIFLLLLGSITKHFKYNKKLIIKYWKHKNYFLFSVAFAACDGDFWDNFINLKIEPFETDPLCGIGIDKVKYLKIRLGCEKYPDFDKRNVRETGSAWCCFINHINHKGPITHLFKFFPSFNNTTIVVDLSASESESEDSDNDRSNLININTFNNNFIFKQQQYIVPDDVEIHQKMDEYIVPDDIDIHIHKTSFSSISLDSQIQQQSNNNYSEMDFKQEEIIIEENFIKNELTEMIELS